jgi:hypothetical protein
VLARCWERRNGVCARCWERRRKRFAFGIPGQGQQSMLSRRPARGMCDIDTGVGVFKLLECAAVFLCKNRRDIPLSDNPRGATSSSGRESLSRIRGLGRCQHSRALIGRECSGHIAQFDNSAQLTAQ